MTSAALSMTGEAVRRDQRLTPTPAPSEDLPQFPHPHGGATDAPDRSDPDPLPAARDVRVGGPRPGGPARRDPRHRPARDARLALARSRRDRGPHHAVHGACTRCTTRCSSRCRPGSARRAWPSRGRLSKDGLTYEFVLRKNAKFHNGDPVTAEDVKFTFERYKGASRQAPQGQGEGGPDRSAPNRVRFVLKEAWPDFIAFYGTSATGAGWIVPKKYIEKVGEEGFKKAPVGPGPYKFASLQSRRGADPGGLPRLLAQGAVGEAPGDALASPTRPPGPPP